MFIVSPILKLFLKIASLVIYFLTALCAFGGYVPPEVMALPSVMVLALPYMVILSVVAILAWLMNKSWLIAGIGILMLIICWTPVHMNFPFNTSKKPADNAVTFTLLTWNVAHGEDFTKPDASFNRTFHTILEKDADIVCLQEMISFTPSEIPNMTQELYDSICSRYPYREKYNAHDVQIFSKYPFTRLPQAEDHYYPNARFARFKIKGHPFMLCNVHLTSYAIDPKDQTVISGIRSPQGLEHSLKNFKNTLYHKLSKSFPLRSGVTKNLLWNIREYQGPVIVCGDFNDVPASWTYRLFIKDGFRDAYADTNPFCTATFYNNFLFFHIDQIMYRGMIRPLWVDRIDVRSSDHYGLISEFEFI